MESVEHSEDFYHVLLTGANSQKLKSGLGLASARRLIDDFLHTRPQSHSLVLTLTTRSQTKADETVRKLRLHLRSVLKRKDAASPGISKLLEPRISFQTELADLTSLLSVRALCERLILSIPKLDAVILNAGIGGWDSVDFVGVIKQLCTEWLVETFTYPKFKVSRPGAVAKPQLPKGSKGTEPPLGEVFCANVFGHYLLAHGLLGPLSRSTSAGRIIWLSTLEASASSLDPNNIQCISAPLAYESSKRLTDVLVLTSTLEATSPWTSSFFNTTSSKSKTNAKTNTTAPSSNPAPTKRPKMYVTHPGVCATSIFPLPWILNMLMIGVFYLTRWCGSIWHTADAYTGSCSPVWIALAPQDTLDTFERRNGPGKWGSAVDRTGDERVERTEVEGWGFGGIEGDASKGAKRKGRRKGAVDLTKEARDDFAVLGRQCWKQMEMLRMDWERRLDKVQPLESVETASPDVVDS